MRKRKNVNMNETDTLTTPVENADEAEAEAENKLLFKPMSYEHRGSTLDTLEFDHLIVPFKQTGNKIFVISFMDACDLSVYTECMRVGENGVLQGYCDISDDMKQCLEVQTFMGVEYRFDKLNKIYNHYMYALSLFVDKGLITEEQAMDLAKAVGFDEEKIPGAVFKVASDLEASKRRNETMRMKAQSTEMIDNLMFNLFDKMINEQDEQKPGTDNEEQKPNTDDMDSQDGQAACEE